MRLVSVASMASLATLLVGSANAMPAPAPFDGDSAVTLAAGGCGPAYHRNIYGGCGPHRWGGRGCRRARVLWRRLRLPRRRLLSRRGLAWRLLSRRRLAWGWLAWRRVSRRRVSRRRPLARRLPQIV